MLWKCYTQYMSKFGKLSSGQRTGKGQFSFQSLRKAMPKNAQTTSQLHSSQFSSVQFSHSVVSDSLRPHESQHTRPPCPSPTPGVHSNSCVLRQWCQQAISSSVVPFSSCPQSFPVSGSFQMSQFFASGGQSIGVSASALPMNIQDWFSLGWTSWISLQSKESSSMPQFESIHSLVLSFLYGPTLTSVHDYWKNHSFE